MPASVFLIPKLVEHLNIRVTNIVADFFNI